MGGGYQKPGREVTRGFPYPWRMTIQDALPYLQSISSICIAGGFLYSALQFRTYRRAQHVANFTKLVELQMHLREMRVHDPELAKVYRDDVEDLTSAKDVREYFFNLMQVSVYEIVWFSNREGQLPDDYFRGWEARMRSIAAEPSFRKMVRNPSMKFMHDEFARHVETLIVTTPERSAE